MKPNMRPARPDFSSGPCAKRPGWTPQALSDAATGRSHRSKLGKKKIVEAVDRTRALLGIPADYRIGIVPASDTGAFEMAMWSLLGPRPVDVLAWESFGAGWVTDIVKELKLKDVKTLKADYGKIADLAAAFRRGFAPHTGMSGIDGAACVHLLCASSAELIYESDCAAVNPFRDELVHGAPRVIDGYIEPSEAPGLGIEVDEALFTRYPGIPGPCYI